MAADVAAKGAELDKAENERQKLAENLSALNEKLKDTEIEFNIKLSGLGVSEQCLREEIKYICSENEQLKKELRHKDESNEKEYLSMKHIEHELKEELVSLQNDLSIRDASLASNDGELQKLIKDKEADIAQLKSAASG